MLALHYKKYKNNFTKTVRSAKFKFYEKKFKIASSNQKLTWKLLNEVTGSKLRSKDNIIKIINNDSEINVKNDPIKTANVFNNFFINIAQNNLNKLIDLKISHVHENISFNKCFFK